jgi:hypothetical protein
MTYFYFLLILDLFLLLLMIINRSVEFFQKTHNNFILIKEDHVRKKKEKGKPTCIQEQP